MDENAPQKKAPDLLERESSWLYMTLASALCGVALFIAGLIWTYAASSEPIEFSRRFDVLYRGALIGAALVTFFTVVWRGLVSTRQVDAQTQQLTLIRRQLEHAEAQSNLNERNELAKLLQKGAELLDSDLQGHRSAGMSTLEFVAQQNRDFAQQALNLLGEKYERDALVPDRARETRRIGTFIEQTYRSEGRRAEVNINFVAPDEGRSWNLAKGFAYVSYKGGDVWGMLGENMIEEGDVFHFHEVIFTHMDIEINNSFFKCVFNNCNVKKLSGFGISNQTFIDCDFSGCVIDKRNRKIRPLNGEGNTYDPLDPPRMQDGEVVSVDWLHANLRPTTE